MRVGVEIGGTFTDLILMADDGAIVRSVKVPSTPHQPGLGAVAALEAMGIPLTEVDSFVHGSTIATNTVLERKGARSGLVTTAGFRDLLEFGREYRRDINDLFYRKPVPLVPRDLVIEVPERITATGSVERGLESAVAAEAVQRLLIEKDVESLAIAFLHSYKNPQHERALRQMLEDNGVGVEISVSSDVLPEFREYERMSTTVLNAYLAPVISRYIDYLDTEVTLRRFSGNLLIMQSNGGVMPAEVARENGVRMLFSGPAGGVAGAVSAARRAGREDLITLDMGGTSTDVCHVQGVPEVTTEGEIDGLAIKVPMLRIVSVGAGGGSIAWVDSGGMLKVGPESAGADPGPACYGRGGTRPTVTDANVVRGLIRPKSFLGGDMTLDPDRAHSALALVAKRLGGSLAHAAEAIFKVATLNIAQATRIVSVQAGHDPRAYSLVAFGGSGPLFAASVAEELQMDEVLVPPYPGLLSAYGLLVSDLRRDYSQTNIAQLDRLDAPAIVETFSALRARAYAEVARFGVSLDDAVFDCVLDMRYRGQAFEVGVPVDFDALEASGVRSLKDGFEAAYAAKYGHVSKSQSIEAVTYRLAVRYLYSEQTYRPQDAAEKGRDPECGPVEIDGHRRDCTYWVREALPSGFSSVGPAIIEEPTATTFVPVGWRVVVDEADNLILTRGAHDDA